MKKLKYNAVTLENSIGSLSVSPPINTVRVLTTLSFAMNPVINAVVIRQSLMPRGLNNGTRKFPNIASRLSAVSCTRFSLVSKFCRNQTAIVAQKIIVKALVAKSFALTLSICKHYGTRKSVIRKLHHKRHRFSFEYK